MDSKMKRRDFLRLSALAGVAVVAAACAPTAVPATAVPAATAVPKVAATAVPATAVPKPTAVPATAVPKPTVVPTKAGFQGEIEFYAATYTPSSVANNPDPKAPKREAMAKLAEEWRALHPGIKFTLFQPPSEADYAGSWLNTQLIGGGGPDVFWLWLNPLNQMADEGKVVALNDYLELPNKYTPEDKTAWKLTFNSPYPTTFSVKGQWGGIALDQVSTGIYANVDMFKSVGIDLVKEIVPELGSPKEWATLVSWCKKFKDAGYFGFSVNLNDPGGWFPRVLLHQLFWNLTEQFDVLNYYENTPKAFQEGIVSQEEVIMQYACNGWKPFSEAATRTQFEIIKDLTQYFPEGFAGKVGASQAEPTSSSDLFMQGQLAMLWDGSWQIGPFMQDNRRKFEFTSFWVPPLTKETTPLAHDPPILPIGVGGIGTSYGINHKCIAKGNVDECVDWLMYISTPKNDELIVNEVPSMIPSVKKARGLPEIASMFVGETRLLAGAKRPWNPIAWWFGYADNKYSDTLKRETDLYLLGDQDLDTFMANMEVSAQEDLPATIRAAAVQYSADGSWDLTRWTCQPKV